MKIQFGTAGWRAVMNDEFIFKNVCVCTQAIADHIREKGDAGKGIAVGYDTRFMSEDFAREVASVLAGNDIAVHLCDAPTPTPAISYHIVKRKLAGGINVTASHNPPNYNGLKFSPDWGGPALPEATRDIETRANKLLETGFFRRIDFSKGVLDGIIMEFNPKPEYLEGLFSLIDTEVIKSAHPRVLVNPLYGTASGYLDFILRELDCEVQMMKGERNPYFGGKRPEPDEENLKDMVTLMKNNGFALGLATDGDADRFGILDADGTFIKPNQLIPLLFDYLIVERKWDGGAARSVATTHMVDKVARFHGKEVFETPVGFKYIGELLCKNCVVIGGEESAGLSVRGHVPEKDGILACLFALEMVAKRNQTLLVQLDQLTTKVGGCRTQRINIDLREGEKATFLDKVQNPPHEFAGKKVVDIITKDGHKFVLADGSWILFRLSGTEPVARIYIEAPDEEGLQNLIKDATGFICGE